MGRILSIMSGLLGAITTFLTWIKERRLIQQGRQEAAIDAIKEVEKRAEQAKAAVDVSDPARSDRLRKRFDRSASGGE